jgi:hypothetical protein
LNSSLQQARNWAVIFRPRYRQNHATFKLAEVHHRMRLILPPADAAISSKSQWAGIDAIQKAGERSS